LLLPDNSNPAPAPAQTTTRHGRLRHWHRIGFFSFIDPTAAASTGLTAALALSRGTGMC
jgi:hypothetical protein